MDEINIINWENTLQVAGNKMLDDKELTTLELINAQVEKPIEIKDVSFSFGALGNFNVQLFNSPDDEDQDAVLGKTPSHIIQPAGNEIWLKYQVKSGIKAKIGTDLKQAGFDIEGEKSVIFTSYRLQQEASKQIREVLKENFNPFLLIAKLEHIKKLTPKEALALYLPGKLNLAVSLNWADIFSGNMTTLEKLAPNNQVLSVEIGAQLKASFAVEVKDDFSLIIYKNEAGNYDLSLKKALSRQLAGNFASSVGITFQDPDAVQKILGTVAEALDTRLKNKVQTILDKNPLQKLGASELETIQILAVVLGFDMGIIDKVVDFTNALKDKLGKFIETVAIDKVLLGFSYEYSRISTSSVILQAELTEKALEQYHAGLIRFKLEEFKGIGGTLHKGLLSDYRNNLATGVTLKNYLNEKVIERKKAWGFSLGIGKWELQGRDTQEFKEIIRENYQKHRQVAFEGVRGYQGNFAGEVLNWKVDFNAQMDRFSQAPIPLANELRYGLFLSIEWKKDKKLKEENIRQLIDQAILWKVITQEQFESLHHTLSETLLKNKADQVEASVQLKFNPDAFLSIAGNIYHLIHNRPQLNTRLISTALGAAMSYVDDFPVRRTVEARAALYGPLWETCLTKSNGFENNSVLELHEIANLAYAAQTRLKKSGEYLLANQEPKSVHSPDDKYFSGTLYMNKNTRIDWGHFKNGLMRLYAGFSQGLIYEEVVKKSFKDLQVFWQQSHYVRALGYYLLYFAQNNFLLTGVDRSLTISYKDKQEEKVINIIGGAS